MAKARDEYRSQLLRRETDYENRTMAVHNETVRALKSQLETASDATRRFKEAAARSAAAEASAVNALATERIGFEGDLHEARRIAKKEFNIAMGIKERMISTRDDKLAKLAEELAAANTNLEAQIEVSNNRLSTIRQICGKLGGQPRLHRTESQLEDSVRSTVSRARVSMASAIGGVIGTVGEEDEISTVALVTALKEHGYLEKVFESEEMWDLRMEWVDQLRDDLSLAWTAQLTSDIRDRLVCSYDKLDELRFSLSHHRVGKELRPRTWFRNPWNGETLKFPQPIRARCGSLGWTRLVKAMQERHGLSMDKQGRVAQRSYANTVKLQYTRDAARGLLRQVTKEDPLTSVLGADGTGIGKRSLMHVACSVAPSYRRCVSVENEKNINTVATSVTDDHWAGLNETLCGGYYTGTGNELPTTCIAAEINQLIATKRLPETDVPVQVRGCFDLVAARGIRGGRGRCACHTESAPAQRFDVPSITATSSWAEAKAMLDKVPVLAAADLRNDSHTPPEGWDYSSGPWNCPRPGCTVKFSSDAEFRVARASFLAMKADKSASGKKATAARAKSYAELHPSQQGEFEPPCTYIDMIDIVIDPLHCLMLNLPKVAWKYTFGDRMTNEQRELVALYLSSVGCPLDIRAKGDGRDANRKWFTGEVFQRFVEGDSLSPGLAENIKAIMDIIYLKAPALPAPTSGGGDESAAATAAPAAPVAKANKTAKNGGGGGKKRKGGFTATDPSVSAAAPTVSAPAPAVSAAAPAVSAAAPEVPTPKPPTPAVSAVSSVDDTAIEAALRARYGSHMDVVKLGLDAWKSIGMLYSEWRERWEERSSTYAEGRAMAFLRCAVDVSLALKAASVNKHKSWYTHLAVWVVPRQMAKHGDLWAFGTSPVEQRGARLKKFVRNVVSWRPYHDGSVTPAGPAQADGSKPQSVFVARRKYESCAMMQILRMCVSQEEMWASTAGAVDLSVSERRMQAVGRSTLLKIERGNGHRLPKLKEEVINLT